MYPKNTGLKHDPSNAQLQEGLQAARQEAQRATGGGMFGPDFLSRLAMHPETRPYLSQPDFMGMISDLQQNPQVLPCTCGVPVFCMCCVYVVVMTKYHNLCCLCVKLGVWTWHRGFVFAFSSV